MSKSAFQNAAFCLSAVLKVRLIPDFEFGRVTADRVCLAIDPMTSNPKKISKIIGVAGG
jgi:hypothetical protein